MPISSKIGIVAIAQSSNGEHRRIGEIEGRHAGRNLAGAVLGGERLGTAGNVDAGTASGERVRLRAPAGR